MEMSREEERGHINVRAVLITVVVLFGSLLVGMALMLLYFNIMDERAAAKDQGAISPVVDTKALPPEPRLQYSNIHKSTEYEDLATMRQHEDSVLNGYAWVDRGAGVVRMPVETAIDVVAERGVGAAKPAAAVANATAPAADTAKPAAPAAATPAPADTAKTH